MPVAWVNMSKEQRDRKNENKRRYYERMKSDPVAYEEFKARCRERHVRQRVRDPEHVRRAERRRAERRRLADEQASRDRFNAWYAANKDNERQRRRRKKNEPTDADWRRIQKAANKEAP